MQKNIYTIFLLRKTSYYSRLVMQKGAMADALVDGEIKMEKDQLLDFLLTS